MDKNYQHKILLSLNEIIIIKLLGLDLGLDLGLGLGLGLG